MTLAMLVLTISIMVSWVSHNTNAYAFVLFEAETELRGTGTQDVLAKEWMWDQLNNTRLLLYCKLHNTVCQTDMK